MIVARIIGKSFHNCVKTVKNLGKYLLWFIATLFVMMAIEGIFKIVGDITGIHVTITRKWMAYILNVVGFWVSGWITYEAFVGLGIFHKDGYQYSVSNRQSDTDTKYDDLPSWANVTSWLLSLGMMAVAVLLYLYIDTSDTYLGQLTLLTVEYISREAGTGIPFTFVVVVLYGGAFLCVVSCLSLLIPVVKYIHRRGLDIFSITGLASLAFYCWNIIGSRVGFLAGYAGRSFAWQYDEYVGNIRYWALLEQNSMTYTFEQQFILPILKALIFNAIIYYVLNLSVKSFDRNLYQVAREGNRLHEDSIGTIDAFKKEELKVNAEHDWVFATLTWTAYGMPMSGWELKRQYTRLGNALNDFAPRMVALYTDDDVQRIKQAQGVVHSENRIRSIISNAKVYCGIIDEFGSFGKYVRQLIKDDDSTMFRNLRNGKTTLYAKLLAADLYYRGFKYIGPAKAGEFLKHNYTKLLK